MRSGLTALDWAARAEWRRRRWDEAPVESGYRRLTWVVVVLLHAVFVLLAWHEMRPHALRVLPAPPREIMQMRLIGTPPAPHAALPPVALPPAPALLPRTAPKPPEPPARNALVVQAPPAPPPRLYDEHGAPLLPAPASSAAVPDYVQRMPQGDAQIMQHRSPIKYQPSRFNDDWDRGGNAVDSALQKLVDKTTVKKTIRLPGGIRIHCAVSLAMLAGGCGGDPPPPPPSKDGDERLNMAPTKSLDGHAHAPAPPSEAACIAMYRAGKPLAYGCPVDTPTRAVDAQLHERAAKQPGQP